MNDMRGCYGMKKTRHYLLAFAICCASSSVLMPLDGVAKTSTQLTADKQQVDQKIKQLKKELQQMNAQFDTYVTTYDALQRDIADIEAGIEVSEEELSARKKIIAQRMKAYQAQDSTLSPYVEAVLGADSLTDLVTRTLSVKKIIDADEALRDTQKTETTQLKENRKQLLQKEAQLDEQFQMMQEAYDELELKRAENKAKSLTLKTQIATAKEKEQLERERKKAERKAAALKKAQEAQAAAIKAAQQAAKEAEEQAEKERQAAAAAKKAQQRAEADAKAQAQAAKVTTPATETVAAAADDTAVSPTAESTSTDVVTSDTNTSADQAETTSVAGSPKAQAIIAEASKYLGRKYVWGGSTPSTGFDCSGLTSWSFKQNGITIPRTAAQQYAASTKISADEAKAGDLVFFSYGKGVAHVGIYLGDGRMINAQNSGLKIAPLAGYWSKYLVGYGRFAGVN